MRIGLTGGIASGKTMVSSRLAELGAAVLDADVFSRTAVEKGSEGLKEIVKAFGGGMLDSEGCLDRRKLGAAVFGVHKRYVHCVFHFFVLAGPVLFLAATYLQIIGK